MKLKQPILLLSLTLLLLSSFSVTGNSPIFTGPEHGLNLFPPDNYADEVVTSMSFFYDSGENALGAPDGLYANMFEYYGPGVIVLDLGRYEICVNGSGDDIRVHTTNNTYRVKIGNDLSAPFTTLGQANETADFDIGSVGFTEARFVQVIFMDVAYVGLDAVEVINLYTVATDTIDPNITPIDDFWVYDNLSLISFSWTVSDATPWNYSIKINSVIDDTEEWYGDPIDFLWTDMTAQNITIVLELFDFFGNYAQDTVNIEIRPLPTKTTYYLMFLLPVVIFLYFRRKKTF